MLKKRIFPYSVFFISVGLGSLLMYNFYSDNQHVIDQAKYVVCDGEPNEECAPHLTMMEKSPYRQRFGFQVGDKTYGVVCTRAQWLVGEHRCAIE